MKLHVVPARQGVLWVKQGVRTFFRQPLAMVGQFFMFVAAVSVLSLLPVVGPMLGIILVPAATVGLMAASRDAHAGRFPMPAVLISAFRSGPVATRGVLTLGVLYLAGFALVLGLTYLVDGGTFFNIYLGREPLTEAAITQGGLGTSSLLFLVLYLPLTLMFWHAPALTVWHGVSPTKSVFFSTVACFRNFWAMTVYSMTWTAFLITVLSMVGMIGGAIGGPQAVMGMLYPVGTIMAAVFFTSIYFTFADSFEID